MLLHYGVVALRCLMMLKPVPGFASVLARMVGLEDAFSLKHSVRSSQGMRSGLALR